MTEISNIDELGINRNLKVRYDRDEIYVSFFERKDINTSFTGKKRDHTFFAPGTTLQSKFNSICLHALIQSPIYLWVCK